MKKFLAVCLLLASSACLPAVAEEPVVRVAEIAGSDNLTYKHGEADWVKTKKDAPGFKKDGFQTDDATAARLELLNGGQVGLRKNTVIQIAEDGSAKTIKTIQLDKGGAWAKFKKQEEKVTIKTRGGVMGIKGTEFSIDTNENGESTVMLVEGSVDYQDDQTGTVHEVQPGQKLRHFKKSEGDSKSYVLSGPPKKVDETEKDFKEGRITEDDLYKAAQVIRGLVSPASEIRSLIEAESPELAFFSSFVLNWVPGVPNWSGWNWGSYVPSIPVPVPISVPGLPF